MISVTLIRLSGYRSAASNWDSSKIIIPKIELTIKIISWIFNNSSSFISQRTTEFKSESENGAAISK